MILRTTVMLRDIKLISIFILLENLVDILIIFHPDFHLLNMTLVFRIDLVFILLAQLLVERVQSNRDVFVDQGFSLFLFELIFATAERVQQLLPGFCHFIALDGSWHHSTLFEHPGCFVIFSIFEEAFTCLGELLKLLEHFCCL